MANAEITRLSKNEAKFIYEAADMPYATYDFENYSNKEFRLRYGIQKDAAYKMCEVLKQKMKQIINKLSTTSDLKQIANDINSKTN